jgi:uncharacterized membrane protein YGL010W
MKTADQWLAEYAHSHTHNINMALHWICVPLTVLSLVGLFWSLPVPLAFREISPVLNWGTTFLMAAVVYYFIISLSLAFGILPFIVIVVAGIVWLETLSIPLWISCGVIFVVAWVGQFVGHLLAGSQPSFVKDLQFLMIGPLWLLAKVYRRIGIPY